MNILSSKNELSNNYKLEMEIDDKKWKNVSHYVYSNLLNYANHKNILKNNLKDISKNFHELSDKEEEELVVEALSTALPFKFSNIELGRKLISTGDVPIVYRSSNTKLGVNEQGEGKNIYGKLLMTIRKTLRNKMNLGYRAQVDNDSKEHIYRSYLIKYLLEDYMHRGMDIRMFLNRDIDSIYNLVAGDYDNSVPVEIYNSFQAYKKSLDRLQRDMVLGFVEPQLRANPDRVVQFVLKNKLRNMQLTLKQRKKTIIYNEYLEDFLLKKNLNNSKVKSAFDSYSEVILNRERFENYLEQAYDKGVLSKSLSTSISNRLKNIRIPTDKEVEEAESVVFDVPQPQPQVQAPQNQPQQQVPDKPKNNTDRFLDSLFNPPKRNQPQNQPQQPEETKTTEQPDTKKYIRPTRRLYQNQSPTQTIPPSSIEQDARAILDAVLQGQNVPEDLLKKYIEQPKSLILDSRATSIYSDLCPVYIDNLWIGNKNENKKLFPSVSHYLMYCIIRNASGNMDQAYGMLFLNPMQFAPLDMINNRYREILISKYDYFLRKAIDVKMQNPEIVQALSNTGNVNLYYNDKYDYILGTGKEKDGNNLTGLYLMQLRNNLNVGKTEPVKELSQLEVFVQNEDVWVEERVKEYCNSILNFGNLENDNMVIQLMDKLYPCNFPSQLGSYEVPKYFTKMVKEENSNLNNNIILYIWNKILSICNYVLLHCKDHLTVPNSMLQKASLVVQNKAFSKNKDRNTAIENAILNIANKIKEVENQSELLIGYAKIATNILLKRRNISAGDIQFDVSDNDSDSDSDSQGTVDYDDGSEDGGGSGREDDIYGEDAPTRRSSGSSKSSTSGTDDNKTILTNSVVKKCIKEVENSDLPENIKQSRINYFQLI